MFSGKRLRLPLLFAFLMFVCSSLSAQNNVEVKVGYYRYLLQETYASCIGGVYDMEHPDTVRIPDEITVNGKSYPVEEISDGAFGSDAAGSLPCKHIVFPKTLKRIGVVALINNGDNPDYMTSDTLFLPEGLESIGEFSLYRLNVKYIYIPASLTSIGPGCFIGCDSLREFIVSPDNPVFTGIVHHGYPMLVNVKTETIQSVSPYGKGDEYRTGYPAMKVGTAAFLDCKRLKRFRLNAGIYPKVYRIGRTPFADCDSLEMIDLGAFCGDTLVWEDFGGEVCLYDYKGNPDQDNYAYKALRVMYGGGYCPRLRHVSLDKKFLPGNVVFIDDIAYVIEKQEKSNHLVAKVLYVPEPCARDTMRFSTITAFNDNYTGTFEVRGVKRNAFPESVKFVHFELQECDSLRNEYDIEWDDPAFYNHDDGRKNNRDITFHLPYEATSNAYREKKYWDIHFGDAKYRTIYLHYPYILPEGISGAVISGADGQLLKADYQYVAGDVVPGNTGLLLKKDNEDDSQYYYRVEMYGENVEDVDVKPVSGENYLRGYDYMDIGSSMFISAKPGELYYKLSYDKTGKHVAFYWGAENGGAFWCTTGRAYLALPAAVASQVSAFSLDGENTTGIHAATGDKIVGKALYGLDGVKRQDGKLPSGIYVVNGQKVFIK